MGLERR
jgi:hypothetical protein